MSSTISNLFGGTPTTASDSGSTSSTQGLFPTQANAGDNRNRGPNVYYLVFLGILVILMMIAGCLAIRAIRVRRRYRTATQLALARGDPIPGGEAYWGLGGIGGWTPDGFDRLGNVERELRRRERDKKNKMPVPVLFESEVHQSRDIESMQEMLRAREGYSLGREEEMDGLWNAEPVSIQSLRPNDPAPLPQQSNPTPLQTPRPRPGHLFSFRQHLASLQLPHTPSTPEVLLPEDRDARAAAQADLLRKETEKEIDRELMPGEEVRMAFMIQMPTPTLTPDQTANGARGKQRSAWDDEDERVGWEEGMELGVWEGRLGPIPPESLHSAEVAWRKRVSSDADSLE
ncbi:hypothetical protein IAT40_002653 [Kwoniella sp. CBS 6097]